MDQMFIGLIHILFSVICRSEDEEFQEAVDLYTSGHLEESLSLAKESLRHSRENLLLVPEVDDDTEVEGGFLLHILLVLR